MTSTMTADIEVDAPIRAVYDQWTQFEEFPEFMDGVEEVRQIDDSHLHWVANVGGRRKEWDAEIVEQTPDRRISWRETAGPHNEGTVDFQPMDGGRTRVTADLERFKKFIERRGSETGAWRGEIHGGRVESTPGDQGAPNL